MKFGYVDESGDEGQGDVFVMTGVLIDAYRLRKYTAKFDKMLVDFLARHPGAPRELKTKALINGTGGWSQVDAVERKNFLTAICDLAAECAKIFAIALSLAADALHEGHRWFDPIYETSRRKGGVIVWDAIPDGKRFDQIVNCAFAIKSQHSSLIQVADAVSYLYRRHLELKSEKEAWNGEQKYFAGLVGKLEPRRELLGRTPGGTCIEFYKAACHKDWTL